MANVLYIGCYRQSCGWGLGSRHFVESLLLTKHNIVCRPIYMSSAIDNNIKPIIQETENKYFDKHPDVIIQHVLPSLLDYQPNCKNIGLFDIETWHLDCTGWIDKIKLMDEIWVSTQYEKDSLLNSNIDVPIYVVPTPMDLTLLDEDIPPMDMPESQDKYIFYFIGEYISRKNLESLIVAFHREFHSSESVRLFIKTSRAGANPEQLYDLLKNEIGKLKTNMRLYNKMENYQEELVSVIRLSDRDIVALHKACDCFVMPSHGESLCKPVMEALYVGNDAIVNGGAGMDELIINNNGWKVESHFTPPIISDPPISYLYTSRELWKSIHIVDLQRCMREAFNNPDNAVRSQHNKQHIKDNFSIEAVGKLMDKIL